MRRRIILTSVAAGIISIIFYLGVVILTTPNFTPFVAASIALRLNGIYIVGISASVAMQRVIVGYGKMLGCDIKKKRTSGANLLSSIASSFFSFFSLVAVGCCGTWLYILSFLPAFFGIGISGVFIEYSTQFAQLGLGLMVLTNVYAYLTFRRKRKNQLKMSFLDINPA